MKRTFNLLIFIVLSLSIYAQTPKPKIRGVVMGISKYMNVPSLQYADRDALSFYEYLLSPAGGKADTNNIRLLLNEKATSYNFFEAMDNLLDAAKEGDVLYIYFAGHGDIEKKTDKQNGFLIGYNAPANCYAAGGSIGVRYLQDYVETLVSKNKSKVILIIDACRSGKLAGGNEGAEITALALKAEWKGVTKILSCQPGEKSLEGDNWGGGAGVFTYFLLKGMKGLADEDKNNNISLVELSHYLDNIVPKETDNKQMPEVVGDKRQDIARVDKETYLAMLNKPERISLLQQNLQSSGFETDLSSITDLSIIKAFERFRKFIKNENLISYNEVDAKKETALSIFHSLEDNPQALAVIKSMKRQLIAALQNKSQISINNWMDGKRTDSLTIDSTYKELNSAFKITDTSYFQYNQLKFRYLFWSNFLEKDENIKMKFLEESIKSSPDEPIAYYCMGGIYQTQKKYDDAYKYFNKASELAKKWVWAWCSKGIALRLLGRLEEALKCYDEAIAIKPEDFNVWNGKGLVLGRMGKFEDAIKCYDNAIEIKPKDVNVFYSWFGKGIALERLGKHAEAINCFDKAIQIRPDNNEAWANKGLALVSLGKPEDALICYDEALKIKPDYVEIWGNKGLVLASQGKYEAAIGCFDKVIELKPEDVNGWYFKGYACYSLLKYEEAIKSFDKVIEFEPDYAEAWYNKACSYSLLKNKEEMLKSMKKAIELKPQFKIDSKKDNDLKEYWDDPEFKKLVE